MNGQLETQKNDLILDKIPSVEVDTFKTTGGLLPPGYKLTILFVRKVPTPGYYTGKEDIA